MITVKITMKISKARTDELLVVIYHMFRNGVDDWVTVMIFQKKPNTYKSNNQKV